VLRPSGEVPSWIIAAQEAIECLPEYNRTLDAATLFRNPLVIWGAAAMEGFFTDDEMTTVVDYISKRFGRISSQSKAPTLMGQVRSLGSLMAYYLIEDGRNEGDISALRRFINFCHYCGAGFEIKLQDGRVLAP
jgi:hypothetical protein